MSELPQGWSVVELATITNRVTKVNPKEFTRSEFFYVDISSVDSTKNIVSEPQSVPSAKAPSRARQLLANGDTVFSTVRPYLRKIGWIPESLSGEVASTGFCVLRAKSDILDPRFLYYFAISDSLLDQVIPLQRGVSYPAIRDKDLLASKIPLPPIDEQKRIVEILEEQLSRLDAALVGLHVAEAKTKSFLNSTIQKQFASVEKWKRLLKGVATVQGGMTPKGLEAWLSDNSSANREIPFYKVSDMNRDDVFMSEARVYLSQSDVATLKVKLLPPGTVIFPKAGGAIATNKKRIITISAGIDLNCMSVRADEEMLPEYLYWWFQGLDLRTISDGSILPQISKSTVETLEIPCPSIPIQERIVEACKLASDASMRVQTSISESKQRAHAFRRTLLNSAFTGQLTKESANV